MKRKKPREECDGGVLGKTPTDVRGRVLRMLGREKGSGRQVAVVGGAKADAFPGFINPTHS